MTIEKLRKIKDKNIISGVEKEVRALLLKTSFDS
jgi:translation elongation factor EF-Tu-like GTPase